VKEQFLEKYVEPTRGRTVAKNPKANKLLTKAFESDTFIEIKRRQAYGF